jgi:zinc/manganese transport system substrate-binding protein
MTASLGSNFSISRRRALAIALATPGLWLLRGAPGFAQSKLRVMATFSILADLVSNVGGERIEIETLVGPNSDAHVYAPTPADAKRVSAATLVFVNGLGFEGWMARLIKASGSKAEIVVAARGIKPRQMGEGHHRGDIDPHAWQSLANAKVYVGNIRDALIAADTSGKTAYETAAADYLKNLDALESEVHDAIAKIPAARRRIITTHDAFGYFQDTYGISFIAPQGVSTDAEPSARDIARIIGQIRHERIPAVFLENVTDPRLLERIAAETGTKIGGTLYSDALTGPDGAAPTYIAMMRHNIRVLAEALIS